jgi:hypothetical protein
MREGAHFGAGLKSPCQVAGDVVVGGVVAGGVVEGCLAVWWSGGDSFCEKSASRQQLEQQRRFQKNLSSPLSRGNVIFLVCSEDRGHGP